MGSALLDLFEFLDEYDIDRCKSEKCLRTGDIVACFDEENNVSSLGKVLHVGKTELTEGHEDGKFGEVFVLPYQKARSKKGGVPYNAQPGWWRYPEVAVLPKENERFSKDEVAASVTYVGHKYTTRREQIQKNWMIEVNPAPVDETTEVQDQGSPRRAPRKAPNKGFKEDCGFKKN